MHACRARARGWPCPPLAGPPSAAAPRDLRGLPRLPSRRPCPARWD